MTHFDEMSCLLYLDGQLDNLKARELELHMRSCTPCRALLASLQRESALLHQAMVEEEESVPARLLAPPGRESAPWGWIVSLGLAALGAFTLWDQIVEPWQRNLSEAGFGGTNLLTMMFFNGVFWKGWTDMATVLQFVAATTLGSPLVYVLWRRRHQLKPLGMMLAVLAMVTLFAPAADAAEIFKGDRYTVAKGETVKNDLVAFCGTLRIDGVLDGDLIAFGESVDIKGTVKGDLIVFARRLNVTGTVEGSIRSFANTATISGQVMRGVMMFAEGLELTDESTVGRGALLFGDSIRLMGRIERDAQLFAKRTELEGFVGGNFLVRGETLSISSSAEVLGAAKYVGRKDPEVASGAKLASPLEKEIPQRKPRHLSFGFYWDLILGYAAVLALGIVILLVAPRAFRQVTQAGRKPASLLGVVVLLAVPVAACVACFTLVGIPLGVISFLLWIILIYAGQVYVGAAIGEAMLGTASTKGASIGRMALGLAVIRALGALRYVFLSGPLTWLLFWGVIASWGLGAITLALYERLRWKPQPSAGLQASEPAL